jgi:hypothetical protein
MQGYGGLLSSSATLTVTAATAPSEPIVSLTIVPGSQSVAIPTETGQFVALGTTGTGVQVDLTDQVTWGSSNVAVATINTAGLATAQGQGVTTITAIAKNPDGSVVPATATFTVTGVATEPLLSLAIVPASQTVALPGQTSQLIAIGTFSSTAPTPGTQNLTGSVSWSSSNQSVATISSPGGLVLAQGQGTAAITAIAKNPDGSVVTATATFTVTGAATEPLLSLSILPNTQSVGAVGQSSQLISIGTFSASSSTPGTQNMANISSYTVTWSSSNQAVVTVGKTTGLATAQGVGTAAITAIATNNTDNSVVTATAAFTVLGPATTQVTSLSVIPGSEAVTLPLAGGNYQSANFVAIGTNGSTGLQQNLTSSVAWSVSNPQVAAISSPGVVTGIGLGSSTITAIYTNPDKSVVTATATLTVTGSAQEPLLSIAILPTTQTVALPGQTSQLIAIGTYSATSSTPGAQNITGSVAWSSSNNSVATVTASGGLVTAQGPGTAAITAIAKNPDGTVVTGVSTFTVTGSATEPLLSLSILPNASSVPAVGQSTQFVSIGTFSAVSSTPGTQNMASISSYTVTWSSSNQSVVTIGKTTGFATAQGLGTAAITAIATNNTDNSVVTATATFTVLGPSTQEVTSLSIVPSSQSVTLPVAGSPYQAANFLVIGSNSTTGFQQVLTTSVAWSSSNPQVAASPNNLGVTYGIGAGSTTITAVYTNPDKAEVTASATLTVTGSTLEPLQSVAILPAAQSVASPGQTSQLVAIGTMSNIPTIQDVTSGLNSPLIKTKWTSSNTSVAIVGSPELPQGAGYPQNVPGLVTGENQGTAAIVTVSTNPDGTLVTSTATFTVAGGSTEEITALQIVPSSQAATAAAQQSKFFVLGTAGTTGLQYDETANPQLVWTSSNKAVATICTVTDPTSCTAPNSVPGLATAVGTGVTTITATWTNLDQSKVVTTASYSVTIGSAQEPLLSINIIPSSISVGQIDDTGQFLAFGNFSTTPTVRDITDVVSWISTTPQIVTIETSGVPGAQAGLGTAIGEGPAVIVAEDTTDNPDKTVVTATATFTCPVGQCSAPVAGQLSTLTVYNAGQNNTTWLVTAPSNNDPTTQLIHCGPDSSNFGYGTPVCIATYPAGTTVTLTVANPQNSTFGGWSSNCTVTNTYQCTVTLADDETVGAIFN